MTSDGMRDRLVKNVFWGILGGVGNGIAPVSSMIEAGVASFEITLFLETIGVMVQ